MTTDLDPIEACLAGRIGPGVACARLLLAGLDTAEIVARLRVAAARDSRFAPLAASGHRIDALARMLEAAGVEHGEAASTAAVAAMFDRAAALSPEASVALYSLGDPGLLAEATAELVVWLDAERLIGPDVDVLDLGCGIGRVALAIAPRCRSVLGLDVSGVMIDEAVRRTSLGPASNIAFAVTGGDDLAGLSRSAFDLVLAVDSMPYVVASGRAERHVADIAGLLRPGGAFAILNLSYRGAAHDAALARSWAERHGFETICASATPFRIWDARAFILRRA